MGLRPCSDASYPTGVGCLLWSWSGGYLKHEPLLLIVSPRRGEDDSPLAETEFDFCMTIAFRRLLYVRTLCTGYLQFSEKTDYDDVEIPFPMFHSSLGSSASTTWTSTGIYRKMWKFSELAT